MLRIALRGVFIELLAIQSCHHEFRLESLWKRIWQEMAKTILTLILVISVAFIHAQNEASDRLRLFRSRLRVRPEDRARYGFKINCQYKAGVLKLFLHFYVL